MAVSKRTRFEVLRRDNYTCRYCRSTEGELTIDHVTPVALGGTDDPSNLVACCKDCNAGKASSAPDAEIVSDVDEDAARWAAARERAISKAKGRSATSEARRAPFLEAWQGWDEDATHLPADWHITVDRWLDSGITVDQLIEALDITLPKRYVRHYDVFRYVAGIVRNWLRELDELTAQELGGDADG
jgi:hypothetical protein